MSKQLTDDELTVFIPKRLMAEWGASRTHPHCKWDADAVIDFLRELALSKAENARLQARVEEEKGITDTAIRAMEQAERERDRHKVLAERRGECFYCALGVPLVAGVGAAEDAPKFIHANSEFPDGERCFYHPDFANARDALASRID